MSVDTLIFIALDIHKEFSKIAYRDYDSYTFRGSLTSTFRPPKADLSKLNVP